jgi:hypothetical protein
MEKHRAVREGIQAGLIGATAVAAWFLIVDLIAGRVLHTPYTLGVALQSFLGATPASMPLTVMLYTVFHYVAFVLAGVVVSQIVNAAEREPSILAGFLILFVAFELGFYGLTVLLSESPAIGEIAWYQIGAANLLAAVLMGTFLLRAHPTVVQRAATSMRGI